MFPDHYASLRDAVLHRVLEEPAASPPAIRRAAAGGTGLPADLQALVDTIHRHAYRVTDEDITRLRATYDDDYLFEIVVSASIGASRRLLENGLAALEEA